MNAQTARTAINEAVIARLGAVVTTFYSEVPNLPGVKPRGRIKPYAVLYPSSGRTDPNPNLAAQPADFLWSGQITFAAGDPADLYATLDVAIPALNLWVPEVVGLGFGPMRPAPGFDSGAARRDDKFVPPRHYLPTLWQLHVITADPSPIA